MNIVFIDDQEDIRDLFPIMIEDGVDAEVATFATVADAHAYIEANKGSISLIISDYNLKDETGLSLFPKISEANIPFFLLTGMDLDPKDESLKTFVDKSINKIFKKPINDEELIEEIKRVTG